jgi:hypothetical protein
LAILSEIGFSINRFSAQCRCFATTKPISNWLPKIEEETKTCADLHGKKVTGELYGVVVGGQLDVVEAVLAVGIVEWKLWGQDSSVQRPSATG